MTEEMDETTNPPRDADVTASEAVPREVIAASALEPVAPASNDVEPSVVTPIVVGPEDVSPPVVAPVTAASVAFAPVAFASVLTAPVAAAPVVTAPEPAPPSRRKQSAVDLISMWLGNLVVSLLTAAFVVIFLYQPVKVEGTSMLPGLEDQERIFVNRFVYRLEPISRGDVIVFRYPRDTSKSYIKRVIGVAGDRIHIVDGLVYVNGEVLSEDYVPQQYADWRSVPELIVPQGSFFMMGDHRNMSSDSRDFGPVEQKFVVGKAVFGYWPFEKLGKVK
jgi:signal peptidase I